MPVSTGPAGHGEPRAKRCKHCDDSTHGADGPASWRLTLDQDLVDTLRTLYPDWFKSTPNGGDLSNNNSNSGNNNNNDNSVVDQNQNSSSAASTSTTTTVLVGGGNGGPVTLSTVRQGPPRTALVVVASMADDGGQQKRSSGQVEDTTANTARPPPLLVSPSRASPPKAIVDASPLQQAMDKNKESLKVKLLMRRPINQLVAQGIMPPLKTPPAFHEQRKQLERAKTGDLLKAKIQQRPDRQELERRHILEQQEGHVDPSLAERQRMLKKARLADQLNDQLSHRPGPLELIKKNILHTDEPIERAVKEGLVPFRATCEGQLNRPQHPSSYVTYEDDSQSSEGGVDTRSTPPRSTESKPIVHVTKAATPAPLPTASFTFAELCQSVVCGNTTTPTFLPLAASPASSLSPLSSISSPPSTHSTASVTPRPTAPSPLQPAQLKTDAPGKDKNRKKSKSSKSLPKARTIKFHEYKGPPSAQKNTALGAAAAAGETSYELLLQQQQLFLQWQLEWQHKYPQIILPANQKPITINSSEPVTIASPQNVTVAVSSPSSSSPPTINNGNNSDIFMKPLGKLEDMKVSDLKIELKKRNLPVSGSKPQLIERLKPHIMISESDSGSVDTPAPPSVSSEESLHGDFSEEVGVNSPRNSLSPASDHEAMDLQADSPGSMCGRQTPAPDEIVKEQQRKIEELKRELHKSQLQVQQMRQAPTNSSQEPKNQKLALQQHLHNKMKSQKISMHLQQLQNLQAQQTKQHQENQQKQQKEHVAFQQGLSAKNQANLLMVQKPIQINGFNIGTIMATPKTDNSTTIVNGLQTVKGKKNLGIVLNKQQAVLVLNKLAKGKLMNEHHRTASLPTILVPANLLTSEQTNVISSPQNISNEINLAHDDMPTITIEPKIEPESNEVLDIKSPPQYEIATSQLKKPQSKSHIKSQIVDDVLEILIKNGELPPSAAQDPATPTTPGTAVLNNGLVYQNSALFLHRPLPYTASNANILTPDVTNQMDNCTRLLQDIASAEHLDHDQFDQDQKVVSDLLLEQQNEEGHLDLKALGLDLETFDCLDFGSLDCDKLESPPEFMDIGDTPMEMDEWLDSLIPVSELHDNNTMSTPPHQYFVTQQHMPISMATSQNADLSTYDPLLGTNSGAFDLLGIEDLKMHSTPLSWDKVDFAT
ncbi:LOW QUALITY PROTEIN: MKL/myocardin-like protein 1 [Ctenocephalides felis]|uniref:LOW QUALITY PROTEIN: MKL/myocardin-like protein 1 n=1 Tax=Ctenocephalides felis TaxID=7515 RepID=UPI000E6E3FBA|nr:LOW QUALITY PROTEIN: MKL/myocardin-like protein 1 [Ctenocephalides felis]